MKTPNYRLPLEQWPENSPTSCWVTLRHICPLCDLSFSGEIYFLLYFSFQVVPLATVSGKPFPRRKFTSHTSMSKDWPMNLAMYYYLSWFCLFLDQFQNPQSYLTVIHISSYIVSRSWSNTQKLRWVRKYELFN